MLHLSRQNWRLNERSLSMRMLCIIRQVPDAEEGIHIRDGRVDLSGSKLVLDTMDEYGVEEALRLREVVPASDILVVAVGSSRCEEALRTALAIGADRAILVETPEALDVIALSGVVAKVAQREHIELIFCGGQQADWDSQALGAAIAERLDWPQVTWVTALSIEGSQLTGKHDVDDGSEALTVELPTVITTQQGLNEPRYPTLPNIIKAKKKPLTVERVENFAVSPCLVSLSHEIQVKERRRKMIQGKDPEALVDALIDCLRAETGVLA